VNRAGAGAGCLPGASSPALLLDRELPDGGAELAGECWWTACLGDGGGGAVTTGWLRSGQNGEDGKRAGEGRVRPKKDRADARERGVDTDGDGGGVAIWIERGVDVFGWTDRLTEVEIFAVNAEGDMAFSGSCSFALFGFSSPNGGISSSGIGTGALVRSRIRSVGKYGLRLQHRVRRRRVAMKAREMGRRTVVRTIDRLRFRRDWMVDVTDTLVGVLAAVVGGIVCHSEETVVTIGKGDEVRELGCTEEGAARVECCIEAKLDGVDDDCIHVVVINVNSCDPEDDGSVDTELEVQLNVV
jgi:hypothetical protein